MVNYLASPSGYVLEFFVRNSSHDYSLREIQKATNVSFRTTQRVIPRFIKEGVIKHTRVVGTKCKMYQLIPSPKMDGLIAFHKSMISKENATIV